MKGNAAAGARSEPHCSSRFPSRCCAHKSGNMWIVRLARSGKDWFRIGLCSLILLLVLLSSKSGSARLTGARACRRLFSGRLNWSVLGRFSQRLVPAQLELNHALGVCENRTHCFCGTQRVRMLSLYPDARRVRSLVSHNGGVSCALRPRGARLSYRCSCEGLSVCRKVGKRTSTQPLTLSADTVDREVLTQRFGYWEVPCERRESEALELVCR